MKIAQITKTCLKISDIQMMNFSLNSPNIINSCSWHGLMIEQDMLCKNARAVLQGVQPATPHFR